MGHSTFSFSKKGILNASQVSEIFNDKKSSSSNGDDIGYCSGPKYSIRISRKVYTSSQVSEMVDNVQSYDSNIVYMLKDNSKPKLNPKLDSLVIKKLKISEKILKEISKDKMKKFIKCAHCSSSLNSEYLYKNLDWIFKLNTHCIEDERFRNFIYSWHKEKDFSQAAHALETKYTKLDRGHFLSKLPRIFKLDFTQDTSISCPLCQKSCCPSFSSNIDKLMDLIKEFNSNALEIDSLINIKGGERDLDSLTEEEKDNVYTVYFEDFHH